MIGYIQTPLINALSKHITTKKSKIIDNLFLNNVKKFTI